MPRKNGHAVCKSCKQHARISWHQIRVNGVISSTCQSSSLCAKCGEVQRDQVPAAACSGAMWSAVRKALGETGQYPIDARKRYKIPMEDIIKNVDERIANPINQKSRRISTGASPTQSPVGKPPQSGMDVQLPAVAAACAENTGQSPADSRPQTCLELHGLAGLIPLEALQECTAKCFRGKPAVEADKGQGFRGPVTMSLAGLCTMAGKKYQEARELTRPLTTRADNPWRGERAGTCRPCVNALKQLVGFKDAQKKARELAIQENSGSHDLTNFTYEQTMAVLQKAYKQVPLTIPQDGRPTKRARCDNEETVESLSEKVRMLADRLTSLENMISAPSIKTERACRSDDHEAIHFLGTMGMTPTVPPPANGGSS